MPYRFLVLVTLILCTVSAGCSSSDKPTEGSKKVPAKTTPTASLDTDFSPKELGIARERAIAFYTAWIAGAGDKSPEELVRDNKDSVTDELAKDIANPTDYDKVLCAQNTPSKPVRSGTKASYSPPTKTVTMQIVEPFDTTDVTVEVQLIKHDDLWKISKITCPDE